MVRNRVNIHPRRLSNYNLPSKFHSTWNNISTNITFFVLFLIFTVVAVFVLPKRRGTERFVHWRTGSHYQITVFDGMHDLLNIVVSSLLLMPISMDKHSSNVRLYNLSKIDSELLDRNVGEQNKLNLIHRLSNVRDQLSVYLFPRTETSKWWSHRKDML